MLQPLSSPSGRECKSVLLFQTKAKTVFVRVFRLKPAVTKRNFPNV